MPKCTPARKRRLKIVISIIIIAAIFWFWKKENAPQETSPSSIPSVKTIEAKESNENELVEISGFVRGKNQAEIAPMASGRILKIFKHEGDFVTKGAAIAIIEASSIDAQVAAASNGVWALEKTLKDTKNYYDQLIDQAKASRDESGTDSADEAVRSAEEARDLQVQALKNQIISAQGSLDIAKAGKNNFTLTSPFSGIITTLYAHEGDFANMSMPLAKISTPENLELETYVSATDGKKISTGNTAVLKLSNGTPVLGIIVAISPASDSYSQKTFLRIQINNSNINQITIGDFVSGKISTQKTQRGILVPRSAIVSKGGDPVVFIIDNKGTAHEKSVQIGKEQDGKILITQGISNGDQITFEGQQYLINNMQVNVEQTK